jgi:transcriptional regulator with XRE-family HTH domain
VRDARLARGLSQRAVASAAAVQQARLSRIERGLVDGARVVELSRILATVGLELSVRAFPGGDALRDAAHLELIYRLIRRLPEGTRWRTEVPVSGSRDRRSWDLVIYLSPAVAVEAENRVRDVQDLERRISLKKRDSGATRVILLLRDTRWNRRVIALHGDRLRAAFPIPAADALAALAAGRDPGGDSVVLL